MQRLRLLHDRARTDASFVEPEPGPAMAALAREFPGALRELDELPLATLVERIAAIDAALADASCVTTWMRASSSFHRHARGALVVKRWLARRTDDGDARRAALDDALPSFDYVEDAREWLDALDALARPPRGRVMDLVYARVAAELGLEVDEVRRTLFTQKT